MLWIRQRNDTLPQATPRALRHVQKEAATKRSWPAYTRLCGRIAWLNINEQRFRDYLAMPKRDRYGVIYSARQLAEKLRVSERTINRYRARVREETQDMPDPADPLSLEIGQLDGPASLDEYAAVAWHCFANARDAREGLEFAGMLGVPVEAIEMARTGFVLPPAELMRRRLGNAWQMGDVPERDKNVVQW